MNKLEEFINELCPDGVEYKPIWELTIWDKKFNTVSKEKQNKVNKHFYYLAADLRALEVENGNIKILTTSATDLWTTEELAGDNMSDGEIVCIPWGGNPIVQYYKGKYITADNRIATSADTSVLDNKFLYYFLQTKMNLISSFYRGSGIKHPDMSKVLDLQIPLPPLSIQSEIVHILDSFTLLTAELTAELTARQKQYAFYRDYLLDFSNEDVTKKIPDIDCSNVEYKRLGDIATAIYRGAGIKRDEVTETGIPCVRYGEIYTTYNVTFNNCVSHTDEDKIQNKKYFEHGDVLFAITGESVEEIAKSCVYLGHDKCLAGGDIVVLKHNQNPKYMAYALSTTNAQSQKSKGKVKSKVVHSSVPAISDIIIPIPPLVEQEKIANMIERFDHLCNDISNGLPAEIEVRKKQYEYYRDTLLSFDDKACSQIVKVERERERANTH